MWVLNIIDLGIIKSVIYINIVIVCGWYIEKYLGDFLTRKIIHIFMAGWWIIRVSHIDNYILWIGPFVFTILTYIYTRKNKVKSGMEDFCFSLTLLTLITMYDNKTVIPATIAILIMGISDPIAAIVGRKYQVSRNQEKDYCLAGSIAFAMSSIIELEIYFCLTGIHSIFAPIIIAIITAYVEAKVFPKYDNIMVPFVAYILSICLI